MEYIVFTFKDEASGEYIGYAPDIPDCMVQRDTIDELHEVIQDAAELCLEDLELPTANSDEYFTEEILAKLSIPLDAKRYTLDVQPEEEDEDDLSYEAILKV